MASQLLLLKDLFETRQGGKKIDLHVTEWKALLMQMDEYELTFADPMLVVMFLQTLPSKFHQFKTYQMMQPTITSEKLYRDVVEFDRANFNKD